MFFFFKLQDTTYRLYLIIFIREDPQKQTITMKLVLKTQESDFTSIVIFINEKNVLCFKLHPQSLVGNEQSKN